MAQTILVTGSTGRQGGSTIRALLDIASDRNIAVTIHALVRDAASDASKILASLSPSVKLFAGNFDDSSSIRAAAKSCTGVFINVMPNKGAPDTELHHARAILAACKDAGTVTRAVYSSASVIGDERAHAELDAWPGMAWYMRSKKAIEDEVLAAGFADGSTVLRPAMFFTNFVAPVATAMYPGLATAGELRTALDPDLKLSCLDPGDIGRFAARALVEHDGGKWRDKIVPLASAHLTMPQIAEKLTDAVGGRKQVKVVPLSDEELAADQRTVLVASELFRNEFRVAVDLDEVRSYGVQLGSWDEFARLEQKSIEAALGLA